MCHSVVASGGGVAGDQNLVCITLGSGNLHQSFPTTQPSQKWKKLVYWCQLFKEVGIPLTLPL